MLVTSAEMSVMIRYRIILPLLILTLIVKFTNCDSVHSDPSSINSFSSSNGKPTNVVIFTYNHFQANTMENHFNGPSDTAKFMENSMKSAIQHGLLNQALTWNGTDTSSHEGLGIGSSNVASTSTLEKPGIHRSKWSRRQSVTPTTTTEGPITPRPLAEASWNELKPKQFCPICDTCTFKPTHSKEAEARGDQDHSTDITKDIESFQSAKSGQGFLSSNILGARFPRASGPLSENSACKQFLALQVIQNEYPKTLSVRCQNKTFLIMQNATNNPTNLERIRRDKPFLLSHLSEKLNDPLTPGRCPTSIAEEPIHSDKHCQYWFQWLWNPVTLDWCTRLKSCEAGRYLKGLVCVDNGSNLRLTSVCSENSFRINDQLLAPEPMVPSFIANDVCEVKGKKVIKDCEVGDYESRRVSMVLFNGQETIVTRSHTFEFSPNFGQSHNYLCSGCAMTGCLRCKGDGYYQSNFDHSEDSNCYCQLQQQPKFGTIKLLMDGYNLPIGYYMTDMMLVGLKKKSKDPSELPSCPLCTIKCVGSKLELTGFPDMSDTVKICATTMCTVHPWSTSVSVPIPYLLLQNEIQVSIFNVNEVILFHKKLSCSISDSCNLIDCHFCFSKLLNPQCYTKTDYVIIFLSTSIVLVFLAILTKVLYLILIVFKLIRMIYLFLSLVVKALYKLGFKFCGVSLKRTKVIYRHLEDLGEGDTLETIEVRDQSKVESAPFRPIRMSYREMEMLKELQPILAKPKTTVILILAILFLISSASGCSSITHTIMEEKDCVITNNEVKCTPSSSIKLNLGTAGTDSCVLVSNSAGPLGTMHFKINTVKSRCIKQFLYWTYKSYPLVETHCSCNVLSACEGECDKSANKLPEEKARDLNLPLGLGPGRSGCIRVPSYYLSSCILPMTACCYYTAELPPVLPLRPLKVETCLSYAWEVSIKVKSFLSSIPDVYSVELTAGEPLQMMGVKFLLTHVSSPVVPSQSDCFVSDSLNNSYLTLCNKPSEQVLGKIGEIQCRSEEYIKNRPSNCSYNPGMITLAQSSASLTQHSNILDVEAALSNKKLPLITPSFSVLRDEKGFYFQRTFSESFGLTISLPQMTALVYSEQTSCTLQYQSIRGCYSCMEGAILSLHGVCGRYPTMGILNCPSTLVTLPLVIKQLGNFSLKLNLATPIIDEVCNYSIGKTKGSFKLQGSLIAIAEITDAVHNTDQVSNKNLSFLEVIKSYGKEVWRIVSNLWNYVKLLILWSLLGLTLILLLYIISRVYTYYKLAQRYEKRA